MLLKKTFKFDAAHNLTKYNGKCENLHGHTYKLVVTVEGKPDNQDMVIDFVLLKKIVQNEVIDILDHAYINDIIENPTARSEEHTSELQSPYVISYAVFCLKKKT